MGRFFPRYKYQAGGVIPRYEGAQVLGRPMQINQNVQPLLYDPSAVFNAINARTSAINTATSIVRERRMDDYYKFQMESSLRDEMRTNLQSLKELFDSGIDKTTSLDYNIPEQAELGMRLNETLNNTYNAATQALTDPNLTPEERMNAVSKAYGNVGKAFSDPEYTKSVARNEALKSTMESWDKILADPNNYILDENLNYNYKLVRDFMSGTIDIMDFRSKIKPISTTGENLDAMDDEIFKMVRLSAELGANNMPDEYRKNKNFLGYAESLENGDYEDVMYDFYKQNPLLRKYLSDSKGLNLEDDEQLRKFAKRQTALAVRTGVNKGSEGLSDGSGAGKLSVGERRDLTIMQDAEANGYRVVSKSGLAAFKKGWPEIQRALDWGETYIENENTPIPNSAPFGQKAYTYKQIKSGEVTINPDSQQAITSMIAKYRDAKNTVEKMDGRPQGGSSNTSLGVNVEPISSEGKANLEAPLYTNPNVPPLFYKNITAREGGVAGSDQLNYNSLYDNAESKDTPFAGMKVTEMTVDELLDFTKKGGEWRNYNNKVHDENTTALGGYQFVGDTLRDLVDKGVIKKDEVFTPEVQDRAAKFLFQRRLNESNNIDKQIAALRTEWAGFKYVPREDMIAMIEEFKKFNSQPKQEGWRPPMAQGQPTSTSNNPNVNKLIEIYKAKLSPNINQ